MAGIGLTVSLFIAELAFEVGPLQDLARLGVLWGSLMAATAGGLALRWTSRSAPVPDAPPWPARGTLFGW